MRRMVSMAALAVVASAWGQPAAAQSGGRPAVDQKQARYQVAQMERMLEGAVEHGATIIRDRLQAVVPASLLISDNARVRGFRLEGYGVFFDVQVPSLEGTMAWSLRTLDQNDLGLQNALRALRSHVDTDGDPSLQQALKRLEIQLGPAAAPAGAATAADGAGGGTGADAASGVMAVSAQSDVQTAPPTRDDPILRDPEEAYRSEVRQAIVDAMLDYSGPLGVGADEWLTVAARRNDDRPRLAPADTDARTMIIRISGADLAAFRAGRLSRDEAIKHLEVRLF